MSKLLETKDLAIGYKKTPIASGINLSLPRGFVTALIGRNGAGKTTLIKTLTGNLAPQQGRITLDGRDLNEIGKKELSKKIALVNTDQHAAGGLRLKELIGLGRIPYTGRFGIQKKEDKETIEAAMRVTGVLDKQDCFISELSDGERQKGMIARGLAQQTPIIIMDEPFSFLDVASRLEIMDLLNNLAKKENKAILLSTHDVTEALKMAENIWLFLRGEVKEGSPDKLIEEGRIDELFPDSRVKFDKERKDFYLYPINA